MRITELSIKDKDKIADLHLRSFESFFLSSLGLSFLKAFYNCIINDSDGISVGIFKDDKLLAFAIGTYNNNNYYYRLAKKNFFILAFAAIPSLIGNPLKLVKLFKSLITSKSIDLGIQNAACLLSICVDPYETKNGLGKLILLEFEKKAFKQSKVLVLTTDVYNNDYVNRFYLHNNYYVHKTYFQGKRKMNIYIKKNEK